MDFQDFLCLILIKIYYKKWWGLINQVLLAYKEDIEEKLQRRIYEE